MKRKIISTALSFSMVTAACAGFALSAQAAANVPKYQTTPRLMEELNRGLVAVKTEADTRGQTQNGVYLSWRLLGTESLENQAFDIYRNGIKIKTTGVHDATCFVDTAGKATDKYKVVRHGENPDQEPETTPTTNFSYAKPNEVGSGNSHPHAFSYVDIPISMPTDIGHANTTALSNYKRGSASGGANDASVGDLDGDGDYEIVLKWDPQDSRDSAGTTTTGHCVIDSYEIDPNNTGYRWRIDLGDNITAGAHYTQFMVYDFDGDGKSEVAMVTARGSYSIDINGEKHYVTEVGDSEEIRNADNSAVELSRGKNIGPEYITIFSGETGRPLKTTAGIPLGASNGSDWGDSKLNRSARYLAAVAYLDGVHPSYIAIRGMYNRSVLRAYNWDGQDFSLVWEHDSGKTKDITKMYGQGNHNLSVADIDNDGKDEIVYGSACLDDDGVTVLGNTQLGHGDAMHTSDFNNDGIQEVFSVKEDSEGFKRGTDFRVALTGEPIWSKTVKSDNGRGLMGNIDDAYASEHPEALALGWAAAHNEAFDFNGNAVAAKPASAGKGDFCNFLVLWDDDLSSELLDANIIQKYDAKNGWTKRFYGPSDGYTLSGQTNNDTKRNYSLVADLWGDWREEIIMPISDSNSCDTHLRIFTSIVPTEYRLTTLMHDCQYREAIAWQNVGYNQPPHTSYYIGSAALATDDNGNKLNYLAPATPYTKVVYSIDPVSVTGMKLSQNTLQLEKTKSTAIQAIITPVDATKKSITWTSSNPAVATVINGNVTGISEGKATITATTKDGGFTDACEVTVYSNPVTGVTVSESAMDIGAGYTKKLNATVLPENATDKSVTWSSSDTTVATVDQDGNVTGISTGAAYIIATTNDGNKKAQCVVTVLPLTITDETGDNAFTAGAADDKTTITTSADSASIAHADANNGTSVTKDFTPHDTGRAALSFRLTTGGQKYDDANWNWTGHEYSFGIALLDTNGNNILELSQAYTTKAQPTMAKIGNSDAVTAKSWTSGGEGENPFDRSAARWKVDVDIDYDKHTGEAKVTGYTSGGEAGITYSTTFAVDEGTSFKTLKLYTTKDGSGTIKASPSISELKYETIMMGEITERPTPRPIPSLQNTFDNEMQGTIINVDLTDQEPYTAIDGVTLYIGTRGSGADMTTNFAISDNGSSGNALVLNSGKFASNNRGPRFAINTPDIKDNYEYTATIMVKPSGADVPLYYNDDPATQATAQLNIEADKQNVITVVISTENGEIERNIYVNDTLAATDNAASFPVFWGTGENDKYTSLAFDNLAIYEKSLIEPTVPPITGNEVYAENGVAVTAEYDSEGRLIEIRVIENIEAGSQVIEAVSASEKVFAWNSLSEMRPIAITTVNSDDIANTSEEVDVPDEVDTPEEVDVPDEVNTSKE